MRLKFTHLFAAAAITLVCSGLPFDSDGNLVSPKEVERSHILEEEADPLKDEEKPSPISIATGMPPIPGAHGEVFFEMKDSDSSASKMLTNVLNTPPSDTNEDANEVVAEAMPPIHRLAPKATLVEVPTTEHHKNAEPDVLKHPRIPSQPISNGVTEEGEVLRHTRDSLQESTEQVVHDAVRASQTPQAVQTNRIEAKAREDAAKVVAHEDKIRREIEAQGKREVNSIKSGKPAAKPAPHKLSSSPHTGSVNCQSERATTCGKTCGVCTKCGEAINAASQCNICRDTLCRSCVPFAKCIPTPGLEGKAKEAAQKANVEAAKAAASPPPSKKGRGGSPLSADALKATSQHHHGHAPAPHARIKSALPHSAASASSSVTLFTAGITALVTMVLMQ